MATDDFLSSEDMIRRAKAQFDEPEPGGDPAGLSSKDLVEVEEIEQEAQQDLAKMLEANRAARSAPTRRRQLPEPRPATQRPPTDPFGRGRSGSRQAVVGAISLAIFILGIAMFLAFAASAP